MVVAVRKVSLGGQIRGQGLVFRRRVSAGAGRSRFCEFSSMRLGPSCKCTYNQVLEGWIHGGRHFGSRLPQTGLSGLPRGIFQFLMVCLVRYRVMLRVGLGREVF